MCHWNLYKFGETLKFQNVSKQLWRNEASFIDITLAVWNTLQITGSIQMILKGSKASRSSVSGTHGSNLPVLFRDWVEDYKLNSSIHNTEESARKLYCFLVAVDFFKMVRVCAYPGCFNQEKSVRLRQWASVQEESLTFHTLPLHDTERLKLWLIALHRDTGSPIQSIRGLRVCSQHFSPSDFNVAKGNKRRLNSTAVPKLFVQQRTEVGVEYKLTTITWFPMDMIRISEGSTYVKGKKKWKRKVTEMNLVVQPVLY